MPPPLALVARASTEPHEQDLRPGPLRTPLVVLDTWIVIAAVLCLATRIRFLFAIPMCAEDAYITFRYALHWAHGQGPVYNPGEHAWGFTSLLWTGYLALVTAVGIPIEVAARGTLLACDLVTLWMGWRLLRPHSRTAATAFALFFATWPRFAHLPATGLESSLVTCLLLTTASLARTRAGGVLNGLLALSRPEGAAMSVLLAALLDRRQRFVWLSIVALYALPMLYFGRLLPSSVGSKASVYGIQLLQGSYWLEWLVPGLPARSDDGIALAPASVLLLGGLVAILIRWRRSLPSDPAVPVLFACGFLTLLGYLALGVPWFFWYSPTPMIAVLLAIALGLSTTRVLRWMWAPLAIWMVFSWPTVADRVVRAQTHDAAVFAGLGSTLREDAAGRPASVMLEPIGIVGYASGLRVLDEVGLVTPWIAGERARGDGWYARVIAHDPPDYLVIRRGWLDGGVAWAGSGSPFTSRAQADSCLAAYHPLRWRAGVLPAGAGNLQILKRGRAETNAARTTTTAPSSASHDPRRNDGDS